ncbi:MAG: cyclic nucleotide-binding domain-containing protein [Nitrospirae bacterium]|nr:cyclic nucleotide-binding domain-containing protein [Nitrospirota bacterium]
MVEPELLKQQFLLEDLDVSDLRKIGNAIREVVVKKGEYVFREKEETKGIFLLDSGKIEISKITLDGWKQTLAVLTKGSFFGELSIIEHRLHEANAVALEDTRILLIPKEDFEKMEKEDLLLATRIMKRLILVLSGNLRQMNEKFLNALISY